MTRLSTAAAGGSPSSPSPSLAAAGPSLGDWTVLGEYRISPRPTSLATRAREPIVAAHPFDASRLAVVYPQGAELGRPVIRISHDGGRTWATTESRPRAGGSHPMLAWGPGPRSGQARLYYAAMGGSAGAYHFIVSYSDDEGRTWHQGFVADTTRGWYGGYEDLAVDLDPASPNYGTLYLAYFWPKDRATGTGLHVVASGDYGESFAETEVPKLRPPTGYGDAWRMGYRLATAKDGSAYVSGYQLDLKVWRYASPFWKGTSANIGRIAFGVARLDFDRRTGRLTHGPAVLATTLPPTAWNLGRVLRGVNVGLADPSWASGLAVDPDGRIHLTVSVDGRIRLVTSEDGGKTWKASLLPRPPDAGGRPQDSMRPEVVAGNGFVAVLYHSVDATGARRTAGTVAAVSFDGGASWMGPRPVTDRRWAIDPIIRTYNGPGMRDRAVVLADGRTVYFAYGDGRDGRSAAFGARIRVELGAALATPRPEPTRSLAPTTDVSGQPSRASSSSASGTTPPSASASPASSGGAPGPPVGAGPMARIGEIPPSIIAVVVGLIAVALIATLARPRDRHGRSLRS